MTTVDLMAEMVAATYGRGPLAALPSPPHAGLYSIGGRATVTEADVRRAEEQTRIAAEHHAAEDERRAKR